MSLCQALVRIVLLTAGLALLPCSLSSLCPFFLCLLFSILSAVRRSWRGGSLVMGPTFGVFPWARKRSHIQGHNYTLREGRELTDMTDRRENDGGKVSFQEKSSSLF